MTDLRVKLILEAIDRITSPIRSMTQAYLSSFQKMNAATKSLRDNLNGAGKSITDFGKGFSLAVSAPVAAFGTLSVRTAAQIEDMMSSLKTVTGSEANANSAMAEITKFATTTPYQLSEVLGSFIKLKALGLDPSMDALRSYGNTASAMGKSLDQYIEAVADASTGEFERLKEFGIKAKQQGKTVTFTFQGVKTKIKNDAASIQEYLKSIGDVQFAGAMEEKMDNFNGVLSNLADTVESSMNRAGQQIMGTLDLKDFFKGIASAIQSLTDAFLALPSGMRDFVVIAGLALAVLGPLLMGVGQLVIGIGGLVMGFNIIAPALIAAAVGIKAFGIALFTTPLGWFLLGVAAVAGAVYLIYRNWGAITGWFASLWEGVKTVFSNAVAAVLEFLSPLIEAVKWIIQGIGIVGRGAGSIMGKGLSLISGNGLGNVMAPSASPITMGGGPRQNVDMGGTLNIKIDAEGRATAAQSQPNDPRLGYTVDSGPLVGAPG